jgi:transposase InsO family protein
MKDLTVVERLIGTVRRERLDHTLFWNVCDLERKLADFQMYYNNRRTHRSLSGDTPAEVAGSDPEQRISLNSFAWKTHRRGVVQLPVAA